MLTNKSVKDLLDELASNSPAPGGGSVAALAGAMGAALTSMVCTLTIGKKKYAGVGGEMNAVFHQSETLRQKLTGLVDNDTQAVNKVMEAFGLPKETEAQKGQRNAAIQSATKDAALVPLEVMHLCLEGLTLAKTTSEKGNASSISDAGVSTIMLYGGLESAALNVRTNLATLHDKEFIETTSKEVESLQQKAFTLLQTNLAIVRGKMAKPA